MNQGFQNGDEGLAIPRLQKTAVHEEFAKSNPYLDVGMTNVVAARRYTEEGKVADDVFGSAKIGVSTTVTDEKLEYWYPDREIQLVRDFDPYFFIPCDRPVYDDDDPRERSEYLGRYLDDLELVANRLPDTALYPLVKGVTELERRRCYRRFRQLGLDVWAYYCSQYYQYGNREKELVRDVHSIVHEGTPSSLLLIGPGTTKTLNQMPPEVTATASQTRWIMESGLRNDRLSTSEVQANFGEWKRRIETALDTGQTGLHQFATAVSGSDTNGN